MRVLVDRLLSAPNFQILVDGLDSNSIEFRFKCISAILEALKFETNLELLGSQDIIRKLVQGLDYLDDVNMESKLLHALYLILSLDSDGMSI